MPSFRRHRRLLAAAFAIAAMPALADTPSPADTTLSASGAREDLELAISAVEAALPNIFWHQTRRQWANAKAQARIRVAAVTDSESLWRILRPLMGQIGEGHLGIQLSDAMNQHYRDVPRFPLDLLWNEQGAFVIAGYGEAATIPRGARLISIDGVDDAELLHQMAAVTPHDGAIRTGTMRDISGRGFASILYRLRGPQSRFHIVFDHSDGRIERDVPAVSRLARPAESDDPPPLPVLEWLDGHRAYLNVPTFSNARLRAAGATFPDAIHMIFTQLDQRGATDLILDLRDNGGGSEPNESILFSYLVDKPLRKYAAVEARGAHIAVTSLSGKRFETDVFDEEEVGQQRPIGKGRLTRRNLPPEGLMSRWTTYAPVYHGRLVVLVGGDTFSGGAELASMLNHTGRGVFVGEEVGGSDEGNTSGHRWTIILPNSRMKLSVPLLQFRMAWSGRPHGRGVRPKCAAPPDVRIDDARQVAVALLKQGWKRPGQAICPGVSR